MPIVSPAAGGINGGGIFAIVLLLFCMLGGGVFWYRRHIQRQRRPLINPLDSVPMQTNYMPPVPVVGSATLLNNEAL